LKIHANIFFETVIRPTENLSILEDSIHGKLIIVPLLVNKWFNHSKIQHLWLFFT